MALPSNLSYGTVKGQFVTAVTDGADADTLPENVPASGTVTFTPSAGVVLSYGENPNPVAIIKAPIVCTLDSEGYLCSPGTTDRGVKLLATDDPTLQPVGWVWKVTYQLEDAAGHPLYTMPNQVFEVPANTVVDLITAAPIAESAGVFITKGDKGDQGIQGIQGEQGIQGIQGVIGPQGIQGVPGDMSPALDTGVGGTKSGGVAISGDILPSTILWTLSGGITITLTDPTDLATSGTITLVVKQNGSGGHTITWPSNILWSQGIVQQPATAANSLSIFHLLWTGDEWVGMLGGKSFA